MADSDDEPTDAFIEALATEVLHLDTGHEVAGAVAIGNRLLARLGGSLEAISSHDPGKRNSLNRLALASRRSPSWFTDRIRVAVQYPRYDEPFRDQVSLSVHVALLRAPEIERNQLLRQAAIQGQSAFWVNRIIDQMLDPDAKPEPLVRPSAIARVLEIEDKLLAEADRITDPAARARMRVESLAVKAMFGRIGRAYAKPPKPAQRRRNKK
jgi:hypothetical protein